MSERKKWTPTTDWVGSDYPISPDYVVNKLVVPLGESESFSMTMPVRLTKRLEWLSEFTGVNRSNLISGLVQYALDTLQNEFNCDVDKFNEYLDDRLQAYYTVCGVSDPDVCDADTLVDSLLKNRV